MTCRRVRGAQDEDGSPGVGMHVDDCRATHEELRAKGVELLQEPQDAGPLRGGGM